MGYFALSRGSSFAYGCDGISSGWEDADIFQPNLPYLDALIHVLNTTAIDPITDEDDGISGGRGDLEFPGQPPRPSQHSLASTPAHTCPAEHVVRCAMHGVTDPTPFIVVTQMKPRPLPPPPELVEPVAEPVEWK